MNKFPGLDYLFLCVINDNNIDFPTAAELIKLEVDERVRKWKEMVKPKYTLSSIHEPGE